MAASYHTRSNSFPSRSSPVVFHFDEQLHRLRSSEFASSSSKLTLLSDLYDCIDELIQLPSSQKVISNQGQDKWVEDGLEGSIKFLDVCSTISDVLVQMKERTQEIQSILRRRCSRDEIAKEVAQYLRSRKNAIKTVTKALKDLKKMENKNTIENNGTTEAVSRLRECQMTTLSVLESVLVSIAGAKARSSWESVISKMLKSKHVTRQQETEFFLVDLEAENPEQMRSSLEKMEISIKDVEEGVNILFRHLIKTRTTILNTLNC